MIVCAWACMVVWAWQFLSMSHARTRPIQDWTNPESIRKNKDMGLTISRHVSSGLLFTTYKITEGGNCVDLNFHLLKWLGLKESLEIKQDLVCPLQHIRSIKRWIHVEIILVYLLFKSFILSLYFSPLIHLPRRFNPCC